MAFIAVGGGIAMLAAGVGSAYLSYKAQQSAIGAQESALNNLKQVNIPAINQLASSEDLTKYQADFLAQANIDPQFAALRSQGASSVLSALTDNANPNSNTNKGAAALAQSTLNNVAPTQSVISGLISQAQQELNAGATLPPAFQAELVRSGLAQGGASGTGVTGEGATGVGVRTLLGSAGINLEAERQQQAEAAAGSAGTLESQQNQALSELTQLSASLNASKAALGGGAVGMANASMPSIGLSGTQDANIAVGNTNQQNQNTLAAGNLNAQGALAQGQMWSGILGSLGSAAGGMAGSWLSGLNAGGGSNVGSIASGGTPGGSLAGGAPFSLNSGGTGLYSGLVAAQ